MRKLELKPGILNPFRLVIPDSADPDLIVDLFESVETFDYLRGKGHHIVIGPRGSGKSMILKRLSATVKARRTHPEHPAFLGIYVVLRSAHAELFRRFCRDTGDTRPFQHFLCAYVLAQAVSEIASQPFADDLLHHVVHLFSSAGAIFPTQALDSYTGLKRALDEQWETACRIADGVVRSNGQFMQSARMPDVMARFADVLKEHAGHTGGIALLLDSYGYLKELGGFVSDWMRKDSVDLFSVKASGVMTHEALNSHVVEHPPEPGHDYFLIPHHFDPVADECLQIFRGIANKRLKREGLQVTVDDLLPRNLGDPDRAKLRWVAPQPGPLEYIVALSGGDVGAFLNILEHAWTAIVKKDGRYPVTPESLGAMCRKSSTTYWRETIPVQARDEWRELQSLTRSAAANASVASSTATNVAEVPIGFDLENAGELDPELKRVIQTGIRLGILQCDASERSALEIDSAYCPRKIQLNRRLCACTDFELDPRGKALKPVTIKELLDWVNTPYHGQDDKPRTGAGPQRSPFSWQQCVFISCPLPTETAKRPAPQQRLLNAIFAALVSADQSAGRLPRKPPVEELVRDPLDLRIDDFVRQIPEAIKNCRFVVHDVTTLSPGVAFELGLAVGFRKARKLVWDEARKPFKPAELPLLLQCQFNVNHYSFTNEAGFKSWLDQNVIRPSLEEVAQGVHAVEPQRQKDTSFFYVGDRFPELASALLRQTAGFREPRHDEGSEEHRTFARYHTQLRLASFAVINYDPEDLLSAVLLGLAVGANTPTIMTYDRRSAERLVMWGDRPFVEWSASTLDSDLLTQEFASKTRQLTKGSRAPH
jgi:hypothetical protein